MIRFDRIQKGFLEAVTEMIIALGLFLFTTQCAIDMP